MSILFRNSPLLPVGQRVRPRFCSWISEDIAAFLRGQVFDRHSEGIPGAVQERLTSWQNTLWFCRF